MDQLTRQTAKVFAASPLIILSLAFFFFTSEVHAQCAFNPSGHFYSKISLPAEFADFDHLTLWESKNEPDVSLRPGLYTRAQLFGFARTNRIAPFEFSTAQLNGTSYSFSGSFHLVCIFEEEFRRHAGEVFLEGKLVKLENGRQVAETPVQFLYSPVLRDAPPNVNARFPSGRTELFYVTVEENFSRMRTLLSQGANPNLADDAGKTPLIAAIKFVDDEKAGTAVQILISGGADVNIADQRGMTPLMYAGYLFEDKRGTVVSKLLAAHANVNAADADGTTVLMHVIHGATQVAALIRNVSAIVQAGADVNARNSLGQTALSIAQSEEDEKIIALLKRAGAKS
jgi:uncharacterized protein